jgi:hypothetical protein
LLSNSWKNKKESEMENVFREMPPEKIPFMNLVDKSFESFSSAEQIRHLEVEGFIVFPKILNEKQINEVKSEMSDAEMSHTDYSTKQKRSVKQPQWHSNAVAKLIGFKPIIEFLKVLMGDEIIFTRGFYQKTLPGCPGISIHTDGQPHGSNLFGYEGTCPKLLRVLYYLDDLTPKKAPFRLIPRSHISFHSDASPYVRYKWHPEELTVMAPAGSAVLIPSMLMHGSHPNLDSHSRELLQFGYRPAWAGPIRPVDDWDKNLILKAPESAKPFLKSLNTTGSQWGQEHKPKYMKTEAKGINPSRWEIS